MSMRTIVLDERLYDYMLGASLREPDVLERLRDETQTTMASPNMQISPEQGQLMGLLVRLVGATKALEVGTFTGYSSISVALAMPPEGRIICCDMSDEYTQVARRYWKDAGIAEKIELRLGPATESLAKLVEEGHAGSFDFAFIDADKDNYDNYYEGALELLRPGGLIAIDNVLLHGRVADPANKEARVQVVRDLNAKIRTDERVHACMIPIGDGLTLALKK